MGKNVNMEFEKYEKHGMENKYEKHEWGENMKNMEWEKI